MSVKINKTNAARLLDRAKIAYELIPYRVDEENLAAAQASGNKRVEMLHMKELLPVTGYIRGGCSPVGMKKGFPTFIHRSCLDYDTIYVSAGVRGLQLKLAPGDLIRFTRAVTADLIG